MQETLAAAFLGTAAVLIMLRARRRCEDWSMRFISGIRSRPAIEGGDEAYTWIPLPLAVASPAHLLAPEPAALPLGSKRGGADGKPLGLHLTLQPKKHASLIAALGGTNKELVFRGQKLCRWTTLSEWDAAAGCRVQRPLAAMLTTERFRRLHCEGGQAQVALYVLAGDLRVLRHATWPPRPA